MKKTMKNEAVATPTRVSEITMAFVEDYTRKSSPEDKEWIVSTYKVAIEVYGKKKAFLSFRAEFAKKFFPEFYEKTDFLARLCKICETEVA